jgi:hypothetical protein
MWKNEHLLIDRRHDTELAMTKGFNRDTVAYTFTCGAIHVPNIRFEYFSLLEKGGRYLRKENCKRLVARTPQVVEKNSMSGKRTYGAEELAYSEGTKEGVSSAVPGYKATFLLLQNQV